MKPNPGHCPPEAAGKRVRGVLRNGHRFGFEPVSPDAKAGWPATGRGECRWSLTDDPFDIAEWELLA